MQSTERGCVGRLNHRLVIGLDDRLNHVARLVWQKLNYWHTTRHGDGLCYCRLEWKQENFYCQIGENLETRMASPNTGTGKWWQQLTRRWQVSTSNIETLTQVSWVRNVPTARPLYQSVISRVARKFCTSLDIIQLSYSVSGIVYKRWTGVCWRLQ